MAITDIGHGAYGVADVEASLAFYTLLGIEEAFRLTRDDGSLMLAYLHVAGDRFIEIFPGGPAAAERAEPKTYSYRHLCLVSDDIRADVEHLRSHGVTIDVEPKLGRDGNTQAWVKDPDGNPIELMQLDPQSPQAAVAAGREPVIPDIA
jgi:lactoylglutathione lyase